MDTQDAGAVVPGGKLGSNSVVTVKATRPFFHKGKRVEIGEVVRGRLGDLGQAVAARRAVHTNQEPGPAPKAKETGDKK